MSVKETVQGQIDHAAERAAAAAVWDRSPARRAAVLDAIAATLTTARVEILATCSQETGLTEDELAPEFARTTGTLRMFAALIREGSWVRAAIDTKQPDPAAAIGPNHDVRKMLLPLGAVVAVFGASNFPLAYGVCGGDTASALAAGCAVIVKEHPAHPKTGRLLTTLARRAIRDAGGDENLIGYIENLDPDDLGPARLLVQHPRVAAVGFTGSRGGGMAIDKLARERPTPIPVFAEMGSSNVVVITGAAAAERGEQIAAELGASILARFGQQCTNTGLVLIDRDSDASAPDPIAGRLRATLDAASPRDMLSPRVRKGYVDAVARVDGGHSSQAGAGSGRRAAAALIPADQQQLARDARYREEVFGPGSLLAYTDAGDSEALREILRGPGDQPQWGQLVACIYLGSAVTDADRAVVALLAEFAGRVVINGPPTGVRVAAGMVHGGPWPATNRPDTTAVGPLAIERWCRPVCFQNCPDSLFPPELRDANPLGILRMVNGAMTRDRVVRV